MDSTIQHQAARTLGVTNVTALARGGQKIVARCATAEGGQAILKLIEIDGAPSDTLERAHREVELLGRIDHPNVVKVLSPLVEIGTPVTAVAWLEEELDGSDLRSHIGHEWDWPDALAMALDVGRGLQALHAQRVVHRDLSPGNVFKRANGVYTVIDPGFGRHLERSTLTGFFQPGTPGHMSPEHAGGRVTFASDVFELGVLMYQVLANELPIPVRGWPDPYLADLRDTDAPSIAIVRLDLPDEAVQAVDRCLRRQSARRFIDADELVAALEHL